MTMTMTRTDRPLLLAVLFSVAAAAASAAPRELLWDDLMPPDWNPFEKLEALYSEIQGDLMDGSEEADRLMRAYREAVASAPVVPELDGQTVRLPGFVVPLDFEGQEVSEFLLVPYFGACIHTPPPPANQIVFVRSAKPYPLSALSAPVWVVGKLSTQAVYNDIGDAGYTMQADSVLPYD